MQGALTMYTARYVFLIVLNTKNRPGQVRTFVAAQLHMCQTKRKENIWQCEADATPCVTNNNTTLEGQTSLYIYENS